MAKSYLTNINLKGNQLLNALIQPSSSAPSAAGTGHIYYNTSTNLIYIYNGTSFIPVNGGITVGASTFYGTTTFAGTANQITLTPSGSTPSGTVTVSLPTAISLNTGGSIAFPGSTSGTVTLAAQATTSSSTISLPSTSSADTLVARNTTDTLANKTLTTPTINGGNINSLTNLGIRSTGTGAFDLTLANSDNLTAGRTLTLNVNDAARTISLGGNITTGGALTTASAFSTSGAFALTLTATATTNATIPAGTVTLVDLSSSQALTSKTINGLTISTTTGTLTIPTATITFSGNNNVSIAGASGGSTVTLPVSGTLATLAGSETFTNKVSYNGLVLTSNSTGWTISGGTTAVAVSFTGGAAYTISGANSQTYTLPSNGGTLVNTGVTALTSLSSVGTIGTGIWQGTNIALGYGGTNASLTATAGGIVYSTASAMAISSAGSSGQVLTSTGTGTPGWTTATNANTASAIVQRDSSGNFSANMISIAGTTTNATDVATKAYVDNFKSGFNLHTAVEAASTTDLTTLGTWGTVTYTAGGGSAATVSGTSGTNTLTVTSPGFNIAIGQFVTGTGLSGLVTVTNVSGTGPYTVTLSATLSTAASGSYSFLDSTGGTGTGATLTPANNGAFVLDNYTPDVGDRILIKNQTTATQNGIYIVTATGAAGSKWTLTRASDYDNSVVAEVVTGDLVYVGATSTEYTTPLPTNLNTSWVMNAQGTGANQSIKIGTDSITFAQFTGAGSVTAGNGISVTGNTISLNTATSGGLTATGGTGTQASILLASNPGLTLSSSGLAVGTGTGLTTSAGNVTFATGTTTQSASGVTGGAYTYATQKQVATITGNGTLTSFAVNHNFASQDISVQIYQTSAAPDTQYAEIEADIVRTSTSVVTVSFAVAPASGTTYNVVMVG